MNQYGEPFPVGRVRSRKLSKFRIWVLLAVPLAAILSQVYLPLFFAYFSYLDLPLLVTVYFAVMRRNPIGGIFTGASIGLVQDSLSQQPLGMFGMVKTLVGFTAASVSVRFDVERVPIRFMLGFFFYLFHHICYWAMRLALLGQGAELEARLAVLLALVNAALGVPLFHVLDKLRKDED